MDPEDKELAAAAEKGLGGQGAVVEAMARLRRELVNQQRATNRSTIVLVVLTVVLAVPLIVSGGEKLLYYLFTLTFWLTELLTVWLSKL